MTNSTVAPRFQHRIALWLMILAVVAGCSESAAGPTPPPPPPPPPPPSVATVSLSPTSATLDIGAMATLTATPRDADGNAMTGKTVTWSSSAPAVATVSAGVVTAVGEGQANITASSDGKSATAIITVNPAPVALVALSEAAATLDIAETLQLVATPRDATGTALTGRTISWTSSDPAIATVDNGLVTAVSAGLATITASSEGKSATAAITVNPAPHPCTSASPTGRLTYSAADTTITYTSHGGWNIRVKLSTITTTDPEGRNKIQNWGNVGGAWHAHENHNGKHIKDFVSTQRSHILGDSTKITINGRLTAQKSQVSIYDNDQTHRFVINHPTDSYEMVWSCALPMFEDELEYDGETSQVSYDDEGMRWHNIYMEEAGPGGTAGPRSYGNEPLSRTYFLNPNNVTDYYDDPRLGHT